MRVYPKFSPEDSDLLSYKWRGDKDGYARTTISKPNPSGPPRQIISQLRAHRVIASRMFGPLSALDIVDHINHDITDCRRENIRITDPLGSAQNKRPNPFRGTKKLPNGKWQASAWVRGECKYRGYYIKREDAARAAAEFRKQAGFLGA